MKVTRGLRPRQVVQRGPGNRGTVSFGGSTKSAGEVRARATGRNGVAWRRSGAARDGQWSAELTGLRTGGPYRIEAEIVANGRTLERIAVPDVLVGDLWVLAGQSNMEGVGVLRDVERPHPLVRNFEMGGTWVAAAEPLHWLPESPDPVHWWGMTQAQRDEFVPNYRRDRERGAGLGLPFARHLVTKTGVPVGLIPVAHGGTNMDQWDPARKAQGGHSLYGSMLRHATDAGASRVAGVLWYQGESEGFETEPSPFLERFLSLVGAMRNDFHDPELPFLFVQIGRSVMTEIPPPRWTEIRELQRQAARRLPRAAMVTAVDLALDDAIHVATPALKTLGIRLARQALRLRFGAKKIRTGPVIRRADIEGEKGDRIRVWYDGVHGELGPARLARGFSVRDATGADLSLVYEAMPDPRAPGSVLVLLRGPVPAGATLSYGWGVDPACTLTDGDGFAAEAFGPLPLNRHKEKTA